MRTQDTGGGGFERIRDASVGDPMWNLFRYCLRYWQRFGIGIITSIFSRICRLAPPIVVAVAIDRVIGAPGDPGILSRLGLTPTDVIQAAEMDRRVALLWRLVFIGAMAYGLRALTRFLSRYWLQTSAQKVQRDLRNDTYRHMQSLSLGFYDNHETGGMMSILNNDINQLETFLNNELIQIVRVATIVTGIGAVMLWVYPKMGLIALAPVPLIGLASGGFLVWIDKKYRAIRETVGRLNSRLANNLGGMKVIKAFTRQGFEQQRVARHSQQYHDQHVEAIRIRRGYFSLLRLVTGVVFLLILYIGGRDVMAGEVSLGVFTMFFLLLRKLYGPMRRIGRTANTYQLARSSAERIFGLLGLEPSIESHPDASSSTRIEGRVTFDNVHFMYDGSTPVLRGVSLDVEAGDTVGLAGETGAGKSTMLKLIPRFYDVDRGAVRIDGVDVREYDPGELRRHIGIVDQDPYLFSGNVMENIAYGDESLLGAVHDRAWDDLPENVRTRLREAAEAAEAMQFIEELPENFDTRIGERGVKLSGGQRQRLSIARALLNDPAIIIFDEATSDVDTQTEALIQRSIDRLIRDRTAFLIAHRLSTIQQADQIVVLDRGRIVERGTHRELLRRKGVYAELWEAQTDEETEPRMGVAGE